LFINIQLANFMQDGPIISLRESIHISSHDSFIIFSKSLQIFDRIQEKRN